MTFQHSANRATTAYTITELLVTMAVIAVLMALALPAFRRAKSKPHRSNCENNLKLISLAFQTWEGDHGDRYPMSVSTNNGGSMEYQAGPGMFHHLSVTSNEINNPIFLLCPTDTRKRASNFETMSNANLGYFVGLDADERFPSFVLSGDRFLLTNGVAVNSGLEIIGPGSPVAWSTQFHSLALAGNILLADGSVQWIDSKDLQRVFQNTGTNLNRLAIP